MNIDDSPSFAADVSRYLPTDYRERLRSDFGIELENIWYTSIIEVLKDYSSETSNVKDGYSVSEDLMRCRAKAERHEFKAGTLLCTMEILLQDDPDTDRWEATFGYIFKIKLRDIDKEMLAQHIGRLAATQLHLAKAERNAEKSLKKIGNTRVDRNRLWTSLILIWGVGLKQEFDFTVETLDGKLKSRMFDFIRLTCAKLMTAKSDFSDDVFKKFWRTHKNDLKNGRRVWLGEGFRTVPVDSLLQSLE